MNADDIIITFLGKPREESRKYFINITQNSQWVLWKILYKFIFLYIFIYSYILNLNTGSLFEPVFSGVQEVLLFEERWQNFKTFLFLRWKWRRVESMWILFIFISGSVERFCHCSDIYYVCFANSPVILTISMVNITNLADRKERLPTVILRSKIESEMGNKIFTFYIWGLNRGVKFHLSSYISTTFLLRSNFTVV